MYNFLEERFNEDMGLKRLVVESCRMHVIEDVSELVELVEEVEWTDEEEVGEDFEGTEDSDSDELSEYAQGMYGDFYYDFY